jgi:sodium pump decarboxylase gamma subunit
MKDLGFGLTMTIMGMGVTFLTLLVLIYVILFMSKLFPYKKEDEGDKDKK